MIIHYTNPKMVTLAKPLYQIGKALARSHWQTFAKASFRHKEIQSYLVCEMINAIKSECYQLVSKKYPSMLQKKSKKDLVNFSWHLLISELTNRAPLLLSLLSAVADLRMSKKRLNIPVSCLPFVGMASAVLLKCRNKHMSAVQHIMSMILNAGHANSRVRCSL